MHDLSRLRRDLKNLIADNIGKGLKKLDQVLNGDSEAFNTFIQLQADYNRWQKASLRGGLTPEEENRQMADLISRLLSFVDSLREEDLQVAYELRETTFEKILVVCKLPERVPYMQRFFPKAYFPNVDFLPSEPIPDPDDFEFIIFDNEPFDDDQGRHQLLMKYINREKPPVLYFGKPLSLLHNKEFSEKVYFANSRFSLHARLNEMILYLKYFDYKE